MHNSIIVISYVRSIFIIDTYYTKCTWSVSGKTKECGDCGNFGDCSESCGAEGIKEGTKECWLVDGKTGLEVPSSRETMQCNDTCYAKCPPIPTCGQCGNYGSCSESCGAEGTKEGTKDCWLEDADTGKEIDDSRHGVTCSETCYVKCPPIPRCGPCGNYGSCSESCGAEGTKEGTKDCWLEDADTGKEIDDSRHGVTCSEICYVKCPPIPRCGPCGNYGSCSESCGAEGTKEGTKDCWLEDADTGKEIDDSRHGVTCSETCYVKCPPIPRCGPCGNYGSCSESCGAEGTKEGTKDCWLEDADTGKEIDDSRHGVTCSEICYVKCPPIPRCGPCGNYGSCSESCGAEGTKEGTKDCWLEDADTGKEIDDSRHGVTCSEICYVKCPPIPRCGPCGNYGSCSESCGAEGTKEGTKDCWLEDADTGKEIDDSRHGVTCSETCYVKCPTIPRCGPCGNYGSCSESCGAEGTKEGTKDCWLEDADTGKEIDDSRHGVTCSKTCYVKCPPIPRCGPCGNYGSCSESCGAEGTKEGTKDCWLEDADTGKEIDDSRHGVTCSETCYVKCPPIPRCGPCGNYGSCSESCGAEGTKEGTKDCWLEDADTGKEIDDSRHGVTCSETCYVKCPPIPRCGPCGNYGSCSESCGAEGTKEGTKDCWLEDADTGKEIDDSRHGVTCSETCYIKCPPIPRCGPCGNYGSCSESCGAEGTKEGTKDCWLEDADTGEEIDNSRHGVTCSETCFKECLCKVYNSYRCLVVEMSYFINLLLSTIIYSNWIMKINYYASCIYVRKE